MIRKLLRKLMGEDLTKGEELYHKINLSIILLSFVAFVTLYFFLPEEIPVLHEGDKLIYIPSILGVLLAPVILAVIHFTLAIQKRVNKLSSILLGGLSVGVFIYYLTMIG